MRGSKLLKFGGTSMGSSEMILTVVSIIKKALKFGEVPAVAVSAMHSVTNTLIEIAHLAEKKDESYKRRLGELLERHRKAVISLVSKKNQKDSLSNIETLINALRESLEKVEVSEKLSRANQDEIMSYGERLCATILTDALNDKGVPCEYLDASTVIVTDDNFGSALVDFKRTYEKIDRHFQSHKKLQIVTGFIAATEDGRITTLGRGGSDYTGSIIGSGLNVKLIEIWTDVSGFMTADPKKVPSAFPIESMSY
ncbi:MAG TPA: bifunctional aspartate kinase/homoserine dehydrogenase I, partial [Candidatus Paceibacterota bacterium]